VTYSNETFEKNRHTYTRLVVANEVRGIHFEYGQGQCESFTRAEEELKSGKWEGTLTQEVPKGNLEWNSGLVQD